MVIDFVRRAIDYQSVSLSRRLQKHKLAIDMALYKLTSNISDNRQTMSRLAQLPAEIRLQLYTYIFPLLLDEDAFSNLGNVELGPRFALLRTCRFFYFDCRQYAYQNTILCWAAPYLSSLYHLGTNDTYRWEGLLTKHQKDYIQHVDSVALRLRRSNAHQYITYLSIAGWGFTAIFERNRYQSKAANRWDPFKTEEHCDWTQRGQYQRKNSFFEDNPFPNVKYVVIRTSYAHYVPAAIGDLIPCLPRLRAVVHDGRKPGERWQGRSWLDNFFEGKTTRAYLTAAEMNLSCRPDELKNRRYKDQVGKIPPMIAGPTKIRHIHLYVLRSGSLEDTMKCAMSNSDCSGLEIAEEDRNTEWFMILVRELGEWRYW